jgi:hypothetical protein
MEALANPVAPVGGGHQPHALDRKAELYSLGSFCQISGWVRSAKWHRMLHCGLLYNAKRVAQLAIRLAAYLVLTITPVDIGPLKLLQFLASFCQTSQRSTISH